MSSAPAPLDPESVRRLVESFEDGSVPLEQFHHRQHLIVAAWLTAEDPEAAVARMRRGLLALLVKHGKDAYHETVTVFWMRALRHRLRGQPDHWTIDVRIADALAWAESVRPLNVHYSPERLAAGRQVFLEPDLAPWPDAANCTG